ncbi:MdtA/MuxA family multidrug efflux RND transporter periplasmic adaptor subunit [Robbsia sp. Bb-Pol-6]|uniref:MdtA/MuxA family multidrug efflux RND transporter periplasmic adaptor subunit n=1 Tax=Robbsia betulipollinis TaxID=2981849 RepID=A0ABT3ZMN8_9BURK|nr:MdtA/MuxA family multidrug efflux RND transporter periplasmic adaptor subunit [Robbsia betulipollinis]MCY0387824.1 MdtA/MuxA family multidrug efflux RND transporter periplasmic adaptor subunit [Robbsia betulipollinis]
MDETKPDSAAPVTPAASSAAPTPAPRAAAPAPGAPSVPPPLPPEPRPARRGGKSRRVIWLIVLLLVIAAVLLIAIRPWGQAGGARHGGGGGGGRHGGGGMPTDQTQTVRTASAVIGEIPIIRNALGTVTPLATVTVHTQIAGTLQKIGFVEGQHVHKGDFLAQVDPRPYEIQMRQAQGTLRKDQALLTQARLDLQRYKTLLAQDSVARQTYDDQVSLVDQYVGTVAADQASVDTYKLDLTYARIVAPIDGRVGLRQVDVGNYVQTSDTDGVVVITQTQPMSVLFTLPEDDLRVVLPRIASGAVLSASAYDRTNTTQIAVGKLATIDNQIDTTTGTVKLRALFPNTDEALFPNQFVNIRLLVDVLRNAVVVPSAAIQTGSVGTFVYVVKPDHTVTVRKIVAGAVDGERTAVSQGLQAGEAVVIDGVDRLREGARISVAGTQSGAGASPASGTLPGSGAARRHGGHRPHAASAASSN